MAATGAIAARRRKRTRAREVLVARVILVATALALWELLARSGLLFEGVVPKLSVIGQGLGGLLISPAFYGNLQTTAGEVATAILIGVAVIGVLLAETKLSNRGLGFMVIDSYAHFDMPAMYALIIVIFALAVALNTALSQLARGGSPASSANAYLA